ncbi:hypothetical protein KDK_57130 [Dictyobacter kobayashii]|uniref:Uncharacterized protein n=1 Tax=Dictyobacter kobayashii TaxID=2014872 RepID=A0A402AS88_9CHLR|nr:hypothetical protein KDK_57130 [Dictyobacter kobayashii]
MGHQCAGIQGRRSAEGGKRPQRVAPTVGICGWGTCGWDLRLGHMRLGFAGRTCGWGTCGWDLRVIPTGKGLRLSPFLVVRG